MNDGAPLAAQADPLAADARGADFAAAGALFERLDRNLRQIVRGHESALRLLLAGFVAGGHVLIEDLPGTGKTTLAKALARSLAADFRRVQFTPDLLPADIVGLSIYEPATQAFRFHPGPVFTDVLLADEINRAAPRTQSALLEAMAEAQVSLDGERRALSELFFVVATQNPIEQEGTYPLPEAQMDRFMLRLRLGELSEADELQLLDEQGGAQAHAHSLDALTQVARPAEVLAARAAAQAVRTSGEVKRYVVALSQATRRADGVRIGASPRASLALLACARALALQAGQDYVGIDHVQAAAVPVLAHRLLLSRDSALSGDTGERVIERVIEQLAVPV